MCYGWQPLSEEEILKLQKMRNSHKIRKDMSDERLEINTNIFGKVIININYIGEGIKCRIKFG